MDGDSATTAATTTATTTSTTKTEAPPRRRADPRYYQITVLGGLLVYGLLALDFEVRPGNVAAIVGAALLTQLVASRWVGLPRFDPRSPMISALSLCLLLRTGSPWLAAAVAGVTIASKFLIRARGKHVFNPTNFGLVVAILVTDSAWVSPGQWGSAALLGFFLACAGAAVIHRAARSDVTWAFLAAYSGMLFGRAAWLGDPWVIPLHQLQSGALLIFAFFMISDPKTTPDSRPGRIVFAALVAAVAGVFRFGLYEPNGLLYALVLSAPAVPVIDRLFPGVRYRWSAPRRKSIRNTPGIHVPKEAAMTRKLPISRLTLIPILAALLFAALPRPADAFCGFFVAKADTGLFNRASKVVMVRDGDRTVLTMANDYRGEPSEFALVVPVPTFLEREQIHVGDRAVIDHLDAYSAPRLVEYHDPDPCAVYYRKELSRMPAAADAVSEGEAAAARAFGVTIEAEYSVGEYDILILSAEESSGLESWLRQNGYRIPRGASRVLGSYIRQEMRFFVAKVDLEEQARLGYSYLRPLQVAYESRRFMLPIRLGTVNADGPQELFVFALTRTGRVETTNYRTVKLPSGAEVPEFVEGEFADFYRDLFTHQLEKERMRTVFLEYAWDMSWCDPCAADPLSQQELRDLGVFWIGGGPKPGERNRPIRPTPAPDVFVTRLHLRYTADTFPEDLFFQETGDRANYQGRYVIRHPWKGSPDACPQARRYFEELADRREERARTLASLTGWDINSIRQRMQLDDSGPPGDKPDDDEPWWKKLWGGSDDGP